MKKSHNIVLDGQIESMLRRLASYKPQALLLTGESGVGLRAVAYWYATLEPDTTIIEVGPDEKGHIPIETVRDLYKTVRSKKSRLILLIDDIDTMTEPAQNAFLKLLEEPGPDVTFLLTTHHEQRLLKTIHSRVQKVVIPRVTDQTIKDILTQEQVEDSQKAAQLTFLARGRVAELYRLLNEKTYYEEQATLVRDARLFLQGTTYDKIKLTQQYSADRGRTLALLMMARRILRFSLVSNVSVSVVVQLDTIMRVEERIALNGHVKTQMLRYIFTAS